MPLPNPSYSNIAAIPDNAQMHRFRDARNLPPGAVVVSREQMTGELMKTVTNWTPRHEMWSITYGMGLLGGLAMTSGMIMNTMYRQKLRLLPHGRVSSYLPLVILPSACSMLLHHMCVTQEVVLMENQCPVCHEVRAASIQTLTGWAMPFSLTLLSSLALARTKHTIHVPNMRDIPALTKFLQKTLKPLGLTLTVLLALNIMVPVWVTQQQLKAAPKVWERVGFKTDEHANEVVDS